jgi:hypothetical protein
MAMAPAAFVFCGAQQRTTANAHSTARRRSLAAPLRECLGEREFETFRFTEGECITEWMMPWEAPLSYGSRDGLNGYANWNQTRDTFPNVPWHLTVGTGHALIDILALAL